jgi:hypothetical protein
MTVSILVATRFPYVDLNAQALLDAKSAFGGVGGVGVAHDPSDSEDGDIAETVGVGVGVGGAGSGGGVEADTLVDELPEDTKSSEVDSDNVPVDAAISVTESMGAPSQNNDDGGVVYGEVVSF